MEVDPRYWATTNGYGNAGLGDCGGGSPGRGENHRSLTYTPGGMVLLP